MFFDFGFIGKNRSPKKHKYIVRQRRATSGASRTWVAGQSSGHKINKDGEPNQKEKKKSGIHRGIANVTVDGDYCLNFIHF